MTLEVSFDQQAGEQTETGNNASFIFKPEVGGNRFLGDEPIYNSTPNKKRIATQV